VPVVERLKQMLKMLTKQNTFRFYSSSLLIMYDGADCSRRDKLLSKVGESDKLCQNQACSLDLCVLNGSKIKKVHTGIEASDKETSETSERQCQKNSDGEQSVKISVRMIDFAHATHNGFLHDKTSHVGPDHGYLFGLNNLIKLFEELQDYELLNSSSG
jgi:inositol-hexakisphosphate 5-kinase